MQSPFHPESSNYRIPLKKQAALPTVGRYRKFLLRRYLLKERETGFEPATSSLGSCDVCDATATDKELTSTPPAACTSACTRSQETDHNEQLEAIVEALRCGLSKTDLGRLVGLLTSLSETQGEGD